MSRASGRVTPMSGIAVSEVNQEGLAMNRADGVRSVGHAACDIGALDEPAERRPHRATEGPYLRDFVTCHATILPHDFGAPCRLRIDNPHRRGHWRWLITGGRVQQQSAERKHPHRRFTGDTARTYRDAGGMTARPAAAVLGVTPGGLIAPKYAATLRMSSGVILLAISAHDAERIVLPLPLFPQLQLQLRVCRELTG